MKCPDCGSRMELKTAGFGRHRGNKFFGCSKYPKCRGLVNFNDAEEDDIKKYYDNEKERNKKSKDRKAKRDKEKKEEQDYENRFNNKMSKVNGYENFIPYPEAREYSQEEQELAKKSLESVREKLLDVSGRYPLINFRHSERKRDQVRFIDEVLDILHDKLDEGKTLHLIPLPEPEGEPEDENTPEFKLELNLSKDTDEIFINAIKELPEDDDGLSKKSLQILRDLKDRVREKLGMEKRLAREVLSRKEYAIRSKLIPNYEMHIVNDENEDTARWNDTNLQTLLFADELDRNLKTVWNKYKQSYEEKGINTLYLILGFLEWYESDHSDKKIVSPLIIQQVDIEREKTNKGHLYKIKSNEEELQINLNLVKRLSDDFGIALPELEEDESPQNYLNKVHEKIATKENWQVKNFLTLGHLQYANILMYQDLDASKWPNENELLGNEIVNDVLFGSENMSDSFLDDYDIDKEENQKIAPYLVLDADSSQHSAIIDVLNNKNLALKGPPGTGKSQTITNVVGAALSQGKKILFVSAKEAALDVVYSRLENIGLGDFCLKLHGVNSKKKELTEALKKRLDVEKSYTRIDIQENADQHKDYKKKLNKYANDLNSIFGNSGETIQQIFWAFIENEDKCKNNIGSAELKNINFDNCKSLTGVQVEDACNKLENLKDIIKSFHKDYKNISTHPFYGIQKSSLNRFEIDDFKNKIITILDNLEIIVNSIKSFRENNNFNEDFSNININFINSLSTNLDQEFPINIDNKIINFASKQRINENHKNIFQDVENLFTSENNLKNKYLNGKNTIEDNNKLLELIIKINDLSLIYDGSIKDININNFEEIKIASSNISYSLDTLIEVVQNLSSIINIRENFSKNHIKKLLEVLKFIGNIDEKYLKYNYEKIISEDNFEFINKTFIKIEKIFKDNDGVEEKYKINFEQNIDQLTRARHKIGQAGFFSFLSSEYNNAKKLFNSLRKKGNVKISNNNHMIMELKRIENYIHDVKEINQDEKIKEIINLNYSDIVSNLTNLKELVSLGREMRQKFSTNKLYAISEIDEKVRNFLLHGNIENIKKLITTIKSKNYLNLDLFSKLEKINSDDLLKKQKSLKVNEEEIINQLKEIITLNTKTDLKIIDLKSLEIDLNELINSNKTIEANKSLINNISIDLNNITQTDIDLSKDTINFLLNISENVSSDNLYYFIVNENIEKNFNLLKNLFNSIKVQVSEIENKYLEISNIATLVEEDFLQGNQLIISNIFNLIAIFKIKIESFDQINSWMSYLSAKYSTEENNIDLLIEASEKNLEITDYFQYAYKKVYYQSLIKKIFSEFKHLQNYNGFNIESDRKRFTELDKKINNLHTKDLIQSLLNRKPPPGIRRGLVRDYTEMGLINHITQGERRKVPSIRKLLERAGDAIRELKPFFMMSPHSVAQFLPPKGIEFDLILIDEASQLKPEFALGALARSKRAVIMGDPMQMPPSTTFERDIDIDEEDEDVQIIDEKSILDVALTKFEARRDLKWHYRSRDESLIAFSNKEFYNDRLIIFPNSFVSTDHLGIKVNKINAFYQGKTNRDEAIETKNKICEFMKKYPNRSCLAVTMNIQQAELIQSLVDDEERKDQDISDYIGKWEGTLEPFTVKNLERVQGDERDCIFISTLFGPPDENTPTAQRFGPINTQYGYRRLNVLFTRAKERIEVITSMNPNDIKFNEGVATGGSSYGRKVLSDYLHYGKTGQLYSGEDSDREIGSDFQLFVGNKLKEKGYEIKQEIGVKGFFIDIGVKHPKYPNKYLIGIECDGATYHSSKSARDRDRLRQEILEGLGWTIYRIWSTDWFNNSENETSKLVKFIEDKAKESLN